MAHYIFNLIGAGQEPLQLALRFLRAGMWLVDADEPHGRSLTRGDLALAYVGAPHRSFVGRARLASEARDWTPERARLPLAAGRRAVLLDQVKEWDPPLPMSAVLARIDRSAGARADFETMVVRITEGEYEAALAAALEATTGIEPV